MNRLRLTAVLGSLALHAAVVLPVLAERAPSFEEEEPVDVVEGDDPDGADPYGDLPIEELENVRFRVSLYEEPPAVAAAGVPAPVEPDAPSVEPPAEPPVAPPTEAEVAVALPLPEPPPPEPPPPEPPPAEVVEAPLPEPVLTEAERAALAEMERGEAVADAAPLDDDDGEAHEAPRERRKLAGRRAPPRERPARKNPCPPPTEDIARVAETHWYIDRDLIEYYATNMFELKKLGSVWTHKGPDGKLDGFRVGLARCSVLRQGGLRSGDVVHDINGRRIHSVLQAVAAYIALRAEPELQVRISRRGEPMVLSYTVEQPQRKGKKAKKGATASR